MMNRFGFFAPLLAAVLLAGCAAAPVSAPAGEAADAAGAQITLDGSGFKTSAAGVAVQGNVLTISKGGAYVLSGDLADGQVVVDAHDAQVQLVLNGVRLSCATGAPIYAKDGKLTVTLADGTENSLTDGTEYTFPDGGDEPSGALFSKDDLTLDGGGSLTVTGQYQHGIVSKDDLVIDGGTLTVTAKADAIRGRDSLTVNDGSITVEAGQDGLQSNNDEDPEKGVVALNGGVLTVAAGNDAVQAETALTVTGGSYTLTTGGGSGDGHYEGETSCKGLKAGTAIAVSGGTFVLDTLDDAIHSNGTVDVTGGTFDIATGDDAVHGDGAVTVGGGDMAVSQCYEGLEGLSVTVSAGAVHLTASDDGINAADPTVQEGPGAGGPGGMRPRTDGGFPPAPPEDGTTAAFAPQNAANLPSPPALPEDAAQDGQAGSGEPAQPAASPEAPAQPGGMLGQGGPGQAANENVFIRITGGTVVVDAQGDALDSNGALYLEGGTVLLNGPTGGGNGALDFNGECTISGTTLVAAGSSGMAQAPGEASAQPSLMVYFTEQQAAGTPVNLSTADGQSIVTFIPAKTFQNLVISTPAMREGDTVALSVNGTGDTDDDGFAAGGDWSGGEKLTEVTLTGAVTKIADDGSAVTGGMGMGGGRGGRHGMGAPAQPQTAGAQAAGEAAQQP